MRTYILHICAILLLRELAHIVFTYIEQPDTLSDSH
jgi:hypothetical protein